MADNLHNFIGTTNWDETTGPSIHMYLLIDSSSSHFDFYSYLDCFFILFFPFTKSVSTLLFPRELPIDQSFNHGNTLTLVNSSCFPNLKTLYIPYFKIEPHHEAVLEKIKLPKTLVSIVIDSYLGVLLSNLNQLNGLHIKFSQ